jgi:uncharacterized Zn finger protein
MEVNIVFPSKRESLDRIYNQIASGEKFELFKDFVQAEKSYKTAKQLVEALKASIEDKQIIPVLDNFYNTIKAKQEKVSFLIQISNNTKTANDNKSQSTKETVQKIKSKEAYLQKVESLINEIEARVREINDMKANDTNMSMMSYVFTANDKSNFVDKTEEAYKFILTKLKNIKSIFDQEKFLTDKKQKYKSEFESLKNKYDALKRKYFNIVLPNGNISSLHSTKLSIK